MNKRFILFVAMAFLLFSCSEDDGNNDQEIDNPEALSEEEALILENLPLDSGYDETTVILPNGLTINEFWDDIGYVTQERQWRSASNSDYESLGPQDARNMFISQLAKTAYDLSNRAKYAKPDEGPNKPEQKNGIAYLWGGKDHTKRQRPSGDESICNYEIYGLDCSGFIYQIFERAGVNFVVGNANRQRKVDVLTSKIKSSIPALDKIKIEDLGEVATSDIASGDIIYWFKPNGVAYHIGIVLERNGSLAVFQSNGRVGENVEDCEKNLGVKRGVRILKLDNPYWFGTSTRYGITRINAELSGKWKLNLRCQGQSADAISFDLDFPTTEENVFEVNGTGIDYDGLPINCKINCNYNNVTNVLEGTVYTTKPAAPNFYRNDSFSVSLDRDEVGYFNLVLGDNIDAGCAVEGKLINNESQNAGRMVNAEKNPSITFSKK